MRIYGAQRAPYWEADGKIVCTITRAASTSINQSMTSARRREEGSNPRSIDAAKARKAEGAEVHAWVREPLDRLASAFLYFGRRDPSWFAQYVLANMNIHWQPQIEQLTLDGSLFPTHLHRFENLNSEWSNVFPSVPLGKARVSFERQSWADIRDQMTPAEVAGIIAKYAADTAFYEAIS